MNTLFAQSQHSIGSQNASTVRWQEGAESSDKFISDGAVVKVLTVGGVTVSASLQDTGWKMRADIMITNRSGQRFDVLPETFTLEVIAPKSKSLAYQSPDKLAKSIYRKARWSVALTMVAGSLATQQSTSKSSAQGSVYATDNTGNLGYGTYKGNSTTTTTFPDYAARERADEQARNIIQSAADAIDYIYRVSLKANTLMPGRDIFGAVYFERDKKAEGVVLTIPVGNTIFEFPFGKKELPFCKK
jgi:hypothetical protein